MRNTIAAIVCGLVFLAALFAAAHFLPGGRDMNQPPNAAQLPQPLRPGFRVVHRTGGWTLECLKPHKIPRWFMHMQHAGAPQGPSAPSPPHSPPCHVISEVRLPRNHAQWMQLIFNLPPGQKFLEALMRIDPDLVEAGEYLDLHLDQAHLRIRVLICGPDACAAVPVIRPQEIATVKGPLADQIVASNKAVLTLPPLAGGKPLMFDIPLQGLRPAIAAFRQHANGTVH